MTSAVCSAVEDVNGVLGVEERSAYRREPDDAVPVSVRDGLKVRVVEVVTFEQQRRAIGRGQGV